MIDRALTMRIANVVAGVRDGRDAALAGLPGDLAAICEDARVRVAAYTGIGCDAGLPPAEDVDRGAWIAANVASMDALLDALGERLAGPLGMLGGPLRAPAAALVSAEAGALTGYLAQRVLGQYEFVLLDPQAQPRLLFVAPNIRAAAERLQVDLEELLTWIAFHEVTHAVQFGGVPWLRPYIADLLQELVGSLRIDVDARALLRAPGVRGVRDRIGAVGERGLVGLVAGPHRGELLDRVQTAMAVVEGHAEHVMDVVGEGALPSLGALRTALDRRRRERPPLLALLDRLLGMDAKLRQYEDGKRFCDAVAARAGAAALHRVFAAPELLPTAAELRDPAAWLARTGVATAA